MMLKEFNVNDTEARQIASQHGFRVPRNSTVEHIDNIIQGNTPSGNPTQKVQRESVQKFCQSNWETLQEVLRCTGNCAEHVNTCTDAQATVCYFLNLSHLDR